ncbi:DUF3018 family protein [Phyllobacterium salinisoli]|uniref:DUF3018 family protein n=1 Tax=Phyllobacterium salinisoli TaxID=1899321 RepID=A0A368K430_9HYPH|nr:antitoxin MazE-like protein [Phyllobacterium salinisoli]RCS22770.1 DUF3018 family protein [Phyllobacterium salinisoli]
MVSASKPKPARVKVGEHRARSRWGAGRAGSSFKAEAHRQSLAVAASAQAADDQAVINAVSDWGGGISGRSRARCGNS